MVANAVIAEGPTQTFNAVVSAAEAYADSQGGWGDRIGSAEWKDQRDAEMLVLKEVISNACLTFPG